MTVAENILKSCSENGLKQRNYATISMKLKCGITDANLGYHECKYSVLDDNTQYCCYRNDEGDCSNIDALLEAFRKMNY